MIIAPAARGFIKAKLLAGVTLSVIVGSPIISQPALTPVSAGNFILSDHGGTTSGASGATLAKSPVSNIAAGSLILVFVHERNTGGTVGTLADSAGNTYVRAGAASPNNASTGGIASLWYVLSCKALSTSQSITFTKGLANTVTAMTAISFTYAGTLSVDQQPTPTTGSSASPSITSAVPIGIAQRLWVGCVAMYLRATADAYNQPSGWTVGPDITLVSGTLGIGGGNLTSSDASAKTYNPTITSRAWSAFLIGFKAS